MDKITVKPFRYWHLLFLPKEFGKVRWDLLKYKATFRCQFYTGWIGGKMVGIGGVMVLWTGVGEGWVMLSDTIKERKYGLTRIVMNCIFESLTKLKLHRLQVLAKCDYEEAKRFVEFFGFYPEAELNQYGEDKSNYWIYSMVDHGS